MVLIKENGIYTIPKNGGISRVLFHHYECDERGIFRNANCIIPTNQNTHNIELDMLKLVPEIINKSPEEIQLSLEMLVRAYDPCISCSVHMVKVKVK